MHITDFKITIIAGLIIQEQENQKMQKGTEWLDPKNVLTPIWLGTPDANTQIALIIVCVNANIKVSHLTGIRS